MSQRIDYYKVAPDAIKIMMNMEGYLGKHVTLDKKLMELVKIRVSQINGCAFCLMMHTAETRKLGETEQRIYGLNAWKECLFYSEQERAALALAEALTQVSMHEISDNLYEATRNHFDEKEYTDLIFLITQINSWNRIAISMGVQVGN
ncbi:carboxymuconolactone decarboxylase family protein [Carnobacterium gallinarum]|uniref:carboxymuconolactone decarboxylase family protein n=1 Tax=Carnobacterium gallinarum TaxID=2749 RepID=UPI00055704E6|nr:carboxymuconolactone decarboxylase family protein [Carnobacterium gallinarum]